MHLTELQNLLDSFDKARGWDRFAASQVFTHLVEELGEISRHISVEEGYKKVGLGHEAPDSIELPREFAQVFSLFMQLANHFKIDLEQSVLSELKLMSDRFPADKWLKAMEHR